MAGLLSDLTLENTNDYVFLEGDVSDCCLFLCNFLNWNVIALQRC